MLNINAFILPPWVFDMPGPIQGHYVYLSFFKYLQTLKLVAQSTCPLAIQCIVQLILFKLCDLQIIPIYRSDFLWKPPKPRGQNPTGLFPQVKPYSGNCLLSLLVCCVCTQHYVCLLDRSRAKLARKYVTVVLALQNRPESSLPARGELVPAPGGQPNLFVPEFVAQENLVAVTYCVRVWVEVLQALLTQKPPEHIQMTSEGPG